MDETGWLCTLSLDSSYRSWWGDGLREALTWGPMSWSTFWRADTPLWGGAHMAPGAPGPQSGNWGPVSDQDTDSLIPMCTIIFSSSVWISTWGVHYLCRFGGSTPRPIKLGRLSSVGAKYFQWFLQSLAFENNSKKSFYLPNLPWHLLEMSEFQVSSRSRGSYPQAPCDGGREANHWERCSQLLVVPPPVPGPWAPISVSVSPEEG